MSIHDVVEAHKTYREVTEKNLFKDEGIIIGPGSPIEGTVNISKETVDRDGNPKKFTLSVNKDEAVFAIKCLTYLFNL